MGATLLSSPRDINSEAKWCRLVMIERPGADIGASQAALDLLKRHQTTSTRPSTTNRFPRSYGNRPEPPAVCPKPPTPQRGSRSRSCLDEFSASRRISEIGPPEEPDPFET